MKNPFNLNTPVQPFVLKEWRRYNVEVFIKRDDLIHPFVSGNKWRKLQLALERARAAEAQTLISFGGAYSNHLLALACAGATLGYQTKAIVRGEQVTNPVLGLCRTWGMELIFVSREAYKDKEALKLAYDQPGFFWIDEGGKGKEGAKGCEAILEGVAGFSHVVTAVGTGTTLAGLATAGQQKGMKAEGICVLKGATEMEQEIQQLTTAPFTLHTNFHEGGYAKTTPALWELIDRVAQETGILLDQVYTAKMVKGTLQLAEAGYFPTQSKLLLVHTGGLMGLLSRYT